MYYTENKINTVLYWCIEQKKIKYYIEIMPRFTSKYVQILGVYFTCDKCAFQVEENWTGRVENIRRIINAWEKRNLSIVGKVCITKAFLISRLVYIMQALGVPDSVLTQVNRLLLRFLWPKKDCNSKAFEKVKRNVVCGDLENGGLSMIGLKQMQTAFLLQWAGRLC